jgi:hypothetical protein
MVGCARSSSDTAVLEAAVAPAVAAAPALLLLPEVPAAADAKS